MSARIASSPILEDLANWGFPHRAAVVFRHSTRPPLRTAGDNSLPLTEEGHEAAVALGTSLGRYSRMTLFHSPALRCEQTAIDVAEGARESGVDVLTVQREELLGGSYFLDRTRGVQTIDALTDTFARTWFSNRLEHGLLKPADVSLKEHLGLVLRVMALADSESRIDLFVTHDLNVMVIREGLFGITHEAVGTPTFLDGVTFRKEAKGMCARYRKNVRNLDPAAR